MKIIKTIAASADKYWLSNGFILENLINTALAAIKNISRDKAVGGWNKWDFRFFEIKSLELFAPITWDKLHAKTGTKFCVLSESGKTVFLIA